MDLLETFGDFDPNNWPDKEDLEQYLFENKESENPFPNLSRDKEEELNAFLSLYQVKPTDSFKGLVLIENNSDPNSPTDSAQTTESEDFQSNLKKEGNRTSRQQRNNEASRKLREKRKQETDKLQDQETKVKLKKHDLENKVNELTIKVQEKYRSQAQLLAHFAQDNPEKFGQYHDNILKLRACTDDVEKQRIYHKVLEHCFEPAVQFVRRPEKYKEVISLTETSSSYSVKTDSSRSGFKRKRRKTGEHLAGKSSAKQQKQENESRNFSQFDEEERYVLLRETIAEAAQQIETFKASWNVYFHHKVSSVNVEQERFCRNMLSCLQYELERMEESEQNEIKIWLSERNHIFERQKVPSQN